MSDSNMYTKGIESPSGHSVNATGVSKFIGKLNMLSGLSLFEYDLATKQVSKVVPDKVESLINDAHGNPIPRHIVHTRDNCVYIQALNMKNAVRKFEKRYGKTEVLTEGVKPGCKI